MKVPQDADFEYFSIAPKLDRRLNMAAANLSKFKI